MNYFNIVLIKVLNNTFHVFLIILNYVNIHKINNYISTENPYV